MSLLLPSASLGVVIIELFLGRRGSLATVTPAPKRNGWYDLFDSLLPYSLALIVVASFLIFIGVILIRQPTDLDLLKTVSAIFLGPIGTILGFYFGYRPAEKLENRLQELIDSNREMLTELEQKKSELQRKTELATETIERAIADKKMALEQIEKLRSLIR